MPVNEEHLLINIIESTYPSAKIYKINIAKNSYGIRVGTKMQQEKSNGACGKPDLVSKTSTKEVQWKLPWSRALMLKA